MLALVGGESWRWLPWAVGVGVSGGLVGAGPPKSVPECRAVTLLGTGAQHRR